MNVIETKGQLEKFLEHYEKQSEVFVDAVPADQTVHRRRSGVSFAFVRTSSRDALFPVRHNDATCLSPKDLLKLNTSAVKYVYDKKAVLHLVPFCNLVDCKLLYYFKHNRPPTVSQPTIHPNEKNIYRPIMRLAEKCQNRADRCKEIVESAGKLIKKTPFQKYNEEILETLFRVERNGMYADSWEFEEIFEKDLTDKSGLSYSNYNLYTQTGRPSNAYKGVNYAALDEDQRPVFQSRFENGKMLNVDYDAFHLRIVSALTGYDAPKGSFHEHLGKLYFGEDELSEEDYKEAKKFTFQFLYNPKGIPDELLQLQFFSSVKELTERIWDIYQTHGVISTAKHKRQITGSNIENFNPAKALNYVLQATSTEVVMEKAKKCMDHISRQGYNTKLVLYLYDSLLFDLHPDDPNTIVEELEGIMEDEHLTVNSEIGDRFGKLEEIHIDEPTSK